MNNELIPQIQQAHIRKCLLRHCHILGLQPDSYCMKNHRKVGAVGLAVSLRSRTYVPCFTAESCETRPAYTLLLSFLPGVAGLFPSGRSVRTSGLSPHTAFSGTLRGAPATDAGFTFLYPVNITDALSSCISQHHFLSKNYSDCYTAEIPGRYKTELGFYNYLIFTSLSFRF
jgi:hypothetical protein